MKNHSLKLKLPNSELQISNLAPITELIFEICETMLDKTSELVTWTMPLILILVPEIWWETIEILLLSRMCCCPRICS